MGRTLTEVCPATGQTSRSPYLTLIKYDFWVTMSALNARECQARVLVWAAVHLQAQAAVRYLW